MIILPLGYQDSPRVSPGSELTELPAQKKKKKKAIINYFFFLNWEECLIKIVIKDIIILIATFNR